MRLIICGDTVPTVTSEPVFKKKDMKALLGDIPKQVFAGADRVLVNLECALTESEGAILKMGPNIKASPSCVWALKDAGITDCALSNNHVLDYGEKGLKDTVAALKRAGIRYTGIGKNEADSRRDHIIEEKGVRVAVIAVAEHEYTYALPDRAGVRPFDEFETMEDISAAADQSDYVVVLYHGGKEQSPYPSPRLRKACRAMARAGADVVICQHSHCIGCMEVYGGAYLLYGQGNFHFIWHSDHLHWQNGLIVQLDLDEDLRFKVIPVMVKTPGVDLAKGDDGKAIMDGFKERSRVMRLKDESQWLKEWRNFCSGVAPNYTKAVSRAFEGHDPVAPGEVFPHYLDCEAHTDVLRELYKSYHKRQDGRLIK